MVYFGPNKGALFFVLLIQFTAVEQHLSNNPQAPTSFSAGTEQPVLAFLSLRCGLLGPQSISGKDCSEPLWT